MTKNIRSTLVIPEKQNRINIDIFLYRAITEKASVRFGIQKVLKGNKKMAVLVDSCCCFSLHTGCKILAILGLISGTIQIGTAIFFLSISPSIERAIKGYHETHFINDLARDWERSMDSYYAINGACLVIGFLYIAVNSCLLHGIRKQRHGLLLPWLYVYLVSITVCLVLAIFLYLGVISFGVFARPMIGSAFFLCCFWNVVRSQYFAIEDAKAGNANVSEEENI